MSLYAEYIKEHDDADIIEWKNGYLTYKQIDVNTVYLMDIYVKPKARGKDLGKKLLDEGARRAKELGCNQVLGSVIPSANNSNLSMKFCLDWGYKLSVCEKDKIWLIKEI